MIAKLTIDLKTPVTPGASVGTNPEIASEKRPSFSESLLAASDTSEKPGRYNENKAKKDLDPAKEVETAPQPVIVSGLVMHVPLSAYQGVENEETSALQPSLEFREESSANTPQVVQADPPADKQNIVSSTTHASVRSGASGNDEDRSVNNNAPLMAEMAGQFDGTPGAIGSMGTGGGKPPVRGTKESTDEKPDANETVRGANGVAIAALVKSIEDTASKAMGCPDESGFAPAKAESRPGSSPPSNRIGIQHPKLTFSAAPEPGLDVDAKAGMIASGGKASADSVAIAPASTQSGTEAFPPMVKGFSDGTGGPNPTQDALTGSVGTEIKTLSAGSEQHSQASSDQSGAKPESQDGLITNNQAPDGFSIHNATFPEPQSNALGPVRTTAGVEQDISANAATQVHQQNYGAATGARDMGTDRPGASALSPQVSPGINVARLMQSVGQSEMRVGMHSSEFGNIAINTLGTKESISAQIVVDHSELARTISASLPEMQAKMSGGQPISVRVEMSGSGAGDPGNGQTAGGWSGMSNGSASQSHTGRQQAGYSSTRHAGECPVGEEPTLPALWRNGDVSHVSSRLDVRV